MLLGFKAGCKYEQYCDIINFSINVVLSNKEDTINLNLNLKINASGLERSKARLQIFKQYRDITIFADYQNMKLFIEHQGFVVCYSIE